MTQRQWTVAWVVCLLLMCIKCAHAETSVFTSTTSGNTTTFGSGNYSNAQLATAAVVVTGTAAVAVEYRGQIATAAGAVFPIVARSAPSVAAMAGAARACFGNPYCIGTAAAAAGALAIANHYGYGLTVDAAGQSTLTKPDPTACTTAPCYEYRYDAYRTGVWGTAQQACNDAAVQAQEVKTAQGYGSLGYTGQLSGIVCKLYFVYGYTGVTLDPQLRSIAPSPDASVPASLADLWRDIETKPFTAPPSAWKDVVDGAVKGGHVVPLAPPSTIDVPKPVVTSAPTVSSLGDGRTKTTTKSTKLTCTPPDCVSMSTSTEVISDPATGTQTTTTTEEGADLVPDVASPAIPGLYTRKYPDGITGVWTARTAELNASPLFNLLQTMTPTIATSNGCPQFSIPAQVGPLKFGTGSFGPPCYVWDFCKVVVLLTAAFLARALIFGG